MSVEQFQQQLLSVYTGSQDPDVQSTAQQANQYTEMFKAGQMTKDEYLQLLADLQRILMIHRTMENMESMEYMNTAINGLINLASLV
jgi:hypothetical protein